MNLFNLYARLTLDDKEYKAAIAQAKANTKELAGSNIEQVRRMSAENKKALATLNEAWKNNKISAGEYKNKLDELEGKQSSYNKLLGETGEETEKTSAKSVIAWAAIAAAIYKVVKAIGKIIVESATYGSEITSLSYKLGLSKEAVQEWDYVAQQNGTTVESLSTAMRNLSNMAVENNEDLINLIGSVKNANGEYKTQEQLLRETLAALNAIPNQQDKNYMSNKILGRSYQELGGLINLTTAEIDAQINKAHELGIVLSDETVASANKMDSELKSLSMMRKAAFAELIYGDPEKGKEILQKYIDNIEAIAPQFIDAGLQLIGKLLVAIVKNYPMAIGLGIAGLAAFGPLGGIAGLLLGAGIDYGMHQLGVYGGSSGGSINGSSSDSGSISNISTTNLTSAYNARTEVAQTMDINITASGNTPISEQTAVDVGKAVLDMLNQVQVTI